MDPENRSKRTAGRPAIGEGDKLGLRIRPDLSAAITAWMAAQGDHQMTKPQAIRRLLWMALAKKG